MVKQGGLKHVQTLKPGDLNVGNPTVMVRFRETMFGKRKEPL